WTARRRQAVSEPAGTQAADERVAARRDEPLQAQPQTTWTPAGETAAPVTEDAVIAAISEVYDPEIPVNIYELGLIYTIDIFDDGRVKVEMTLTAPACPSAQELPEQVRDAVMGVPGVASADVDTVWDPPWDPSRM